VDAAVGDSLVRTLQRHAGNRAVAALLSPQRPASRQVLARDPKKPGIAPARGGPPRMRRFNFRVMLSGPLDPAQMRDEFIRQYYSASSEADVASRRWMWKLPSRGTNDEEVKRGYVDIDVTMSRQTDVESLDPQARKDINDETDKRYWAATGLPEGTKINARDEKAKRQWLGLRNAVLTEDKQLKEIQSLPDDIKQVLFAGGQDAPELAREDFSRVIAVARKLAALTPEERQDYLARITGSTNSLDELEAAIDRYAKFRQERSQQAEAFEQTTQPLFGGDNLYSLYRDWRAWEKIVEGADRSADYANQRGGPGTVDTYEEHEQLERARTAFLAELKRQNFKSVADYEAVIESYRVNFRTQTVNLAVDLLARYEHLLFEERTKLEKGNLGASIAQGIAASGAAALYQKSDEEAETARILQQGVDPEAKGANAALYAKINQHRAAAASAKQEAEAAVVRGSGNDPLVSERKVDLEKLAGLDANGIKAYLLDMIEDRQKDVREAKQDFKDDPDRVFKLPDLVGAVMKVQGIEADSVYGKIISDYISDEKAKHLLRSIVVGIIALALATLVPVGGWVAAAALVGGAALSTYQAYEAINEYEEQERDYRLHFLSEEPSLFWVVVAVAGAAVDIGAATGAIVKVGTLMKESAAGLKALEGPLKEFSRGGELEKLLEQIEKVEGLRPQVRSALEAASREADASRKAWKEAVAAGSTLNMTGNPDAVLSVFHALYSSVKRGVNTLTALRKDAQFLGVMRDITGLSGAERAELEAAFEEVKTLVRTGKNRQMDDATLLEYVDRWAANRPNPTARVKLLDEMKAWRPLTAEQKQAMAAVERQHALVDTLYEEKEELLTEKDDLLQAQRDPATKSSDNAERLREINQRLHELDPASLPQRQGAPKPPPGKIGEAEHALEVAEETARKAQLTLYDRIRAATPSARARDRTIKLWNMERLDKAAKGIPVAGFDQVGKLRRAGGKLSADHIVSVREIAEMDGFKELTWKQQKTIVDMKENLIAMDAAANSSKNDVSWVYWKNASSFYDQATIDVMKAREEIVRKLIADAITDAKAAPVKP
jgi:hypothetical protein